MPTDLMKNTYLLKVEEIEKDLERIWDKYQDLIKNSKTKEEITEARVYLYFLGNFYVENFGKGAIESRLKELEITPLDFYLMVDQNKEELQERRNNETFTKLEKLYNLMKKYKMKVVNNHYLDEGTFNKKYSEIFYNKEIKMYKGKKI